MVAASAFILLAGFGTGFALAARHFELNGSWHLIPARSELHGHEAIQTGTLNISSREGNIWVERNFRLEDRYESVSTHFTTDAREKASISQPGFKSKAQWQGDVLQVVTNQNGSTTVERYSLAEDDILELHVERSSGQSEKFYFERQ